MEKICDKMYWFNLLFPLRVSIYKYWQTNGMILMFHSSIVNGFWFKILFSIIHIMNVYECNGANMFMSWKMECSIQRGGAELNGWNEKARWVTQRAMVLLFAIKWRTILQSNGKDLLGCYITKYIIRFCNRPSCLCPNIERRVRRAILSGGGWLYCSKHQTIQQQTLSSSWTDALHISLVTACVNRYTFFIMKCTLYNF